MFPTQQLRCIASLHAPLHKQADADLEHIASPLTLCGEELMRYIFGWLSQARNMITTAFSNTCSKEEYPFHPASHHTQYTS
jgi:hypothetical protein